jgi:C_GCAxxG_C_C family probable redox protein
MNNEAFRIFQLASQGFCCSQMMLKLALEEEGKDNPDLIRAMNGLCGGIGFSGKTCGVLTGGISILGLYAGKGVPEEVKGEDFSKMIKEFMDWFSEEFESTECNDIVGYPIINDDSGVENYPVKCGDIVIKGYNKIQEILEQYDYAFGERE